MSKAADVHHKNQHLDSPDQKTLGAYIVGLMLCVVLTLISFGLVEKQFLTNQNLYIALAVLALAQFFVQAICFLRLNAGSEGRWNLLPFIFVILIIITLVGGSLWIMYNLNYNMT